MCTQNFTVRYFCCFKRNNYVTIINHCYELGAFLAQTLGRPVGTDAISVLSSLPVFLVSQAAGEFRHQFNMHPSEINRSLHLS